MTSQIPANAPRNELEWAKLLTTLLQDMRFGTLELTIHEGRIVQIERKEKYRFDSRRSD